MKKTLNILGVLLACFIGYLGGVLVSSGNWETGYAIWALFLYAWSKHGLFLIHTDNPQPKE